MSRKLLYVLFPMLIAGCQEPAGSAAPAAQTAPVPTKMSTAPAPAEAAMPNEFPLEDMLKTFGDLEEELRDVDKLPVAEAAERIAQVDEWLYRPAEEEKARKQIDAEVDKLRHRIETKARALLSEAIQAKDGKSASKKMAEINALLLLYPAPGDGAQRARLERLSGDVLKVSRRVEDIRHLRYNHWAIDRIKGSLDAYRSHLKMRGFSDWRKLIGPDRDALIKSSVDWMGPIDPSFLEPAARDLYDYVFGLTRDAMGADDEKRIELVRGFTDPLRERFTPVNF